MWNTDNYYEKMEFVFTEFELENCRRLLEKIPPHTEAYRKVLEEEIKLLQKKKRLAEILDI
jgi:hypothetical protein